MVWATRKLRHNFQFYKVIAVSRMDLVKYLYGTPALVGKLARWLILLSKFDIEYAMKKTVKGRVVANFLAVYPIEDNEQWEIDFPDEHLSLIEKKEWKLYFDGSTYNKGVEVGVLLESPQGEVIPMLKRLRFVVTNNMAEHDACLFGLKALIAVKAKEVEVNQNW
ncbi:uncharacterized protein LOC105647235 [Jatropha curcas]|uniref:uncharacterized protein LOC105647235 n=1 Tax=Jatropha curcas TaxID=180498 RepID=UPI001894FCA0|nr:uncharacterized protein LOC105647235 [Jatropha curcas]